MFPYIPILMKFCINVDEKVESYCLHDHPRFIVLAGVPGVALHFDLDEILHKF